MSKKKVQSSQINTGKIVENAFSKLEEIEDRNFETAKILSSYSLFDLARKVLIENLKKDFDEIEFISAVSKYLFLSNMNLIEQNQLETHKMIIKETKTFFKHIKKALRVIENRFDETYLLYGVDGGFFAIDNVKLIDSFEELSQILNLTNYHKEAEFAFDLKSKLELGFQRYFLQRRGSVVLSWFDESGNYEVANDVDVMRIVEFFELDVESKVNVKTNDFESILVQMNYLKKRNKVDFAKLMKKYVGLFEFFAKEVYSKDEYDNKVGIAKSINKDFEENVMRLVKEKLVLVNPYDVSCYNLVLKILK